ncbi:MAG: hypothetical protein HRU19_29800 [Pseudobacteriovorax sp.]|nr:hypothetical protein [Pseudobacteriovorax sp.]
MDRRHLERAVIGMPGLVLSGFWPTKADCYRKKREEILERPEYLTEFILLVKTIEKSRLKKQVIGNKWAKNLYGLQLIKAVIEKALHQEVHVGLLIAAFNHLGYEIKKTDDETNPLIGFESTTKSLGLKITK